MLDSVASLIFLTIIGNFDFVSSLKGVGYATTAGANCSDLTNLNVTWYYDWTPKSDCKEADFIPMIWGKSNLADISKLAGKGYTTLLGFNEPDNKGQSNISPEDAVNYWPQLMKSGLRLGSPGCTEGGAFGWLKNFMQGIKEKNLKVDFIAVHWYGNCHQPSSVGTFLQKVWDQYQMPIWLTEFSCMQGDASVNEGFFKAVEPILQNAKGLERYAWFADRWPTDQSIYQGVTLFDKAGHLTPLGKIYKIAV